MSQEGGSSSSRPSPAGGGMVDPLDEQAAKWQMHFYQKGRGGRDDDDDDHDARESLRRGS